MKANRAVLCLTVLSLFTIVFESRTCFASYENFAQAAISASASGGLVPGGSSFSQSIEGRNSAGPLTFSGTATGNGLQKVANFAQVSGDVGGLNIKVSSAAILYSGGTIRADARSSGQWRDIISFDTPASTTPPASLKLVFQVDGTLYIDLDGVATSTLLINSGSGDSFINPLIRNGRTAVAEITRPGILAGISLNFDNFANYDYEASTGYFTAIYEMSVNYNPTINGYPFLISAMADSTGGGLIYPYGWAGAALTDLGNTISLFAVKDGNGNTVDPSLLTFASGMKYAVPEPEGWINIAIFTMLSTAPLMRKKIVARRSWIYPS